MADDASLYDTRPDLLCVGNGTVHLPSGELRPHNPDDRLTRITPVDYVPRAVAADWAAALDALDPETVDYLQVRLARR